MNEIITKLNEIEEKADAILSDARAQKDQMTIQLEADKKALDEKYDKIQQDGAAEYRAKLQEKTKEQMHRRSEQTKEDIKALEKSFLEQKEEMAQEIFERIIS